MFETIPLANSDTVCLADAPPEHSRDVVPDMPDRIIAATALVPAGGASVMRPLLLHASSACAVPTSRRVIHIEFATGDLPEGLVWHDRL